MNGHMLKHWMFVCVAVLLTWPLLAATPPVAAESANLIQNGDFERGNLDEWDTCGGVRLADTQAGATLLEVHDGRYALRLGSPTNDSCDTGVFGTRQQAYYENIVVPADAAALTWNFWYSRSGDFSSNAASWELNALLVSADNGPQVRILEYLSPGESGGWNQARFELSPEEVVQARGRTFYISFSIQSSLNAEDRLVYAIDDMQLLPSTVRTPTEAAPPPTLTSDTSGALVGYTVADGKGRTARANLDGSNLRPLYAGQLDDGGSKPKWSKDGTQIVDWDWSPDGRAIALNICTTNRYADGYTTDAICSIRFVDLASGTLQNTVIEHATGVSWSTANRLLYRVNIEGPILYNTPKGIYEADMNTSPPTTRLLFAHLSKTYTLEDVGPTWATDGRSFVSLRFVQGNHYDANGQSQFNSVLMLFDRENPDTPRQLVLVDYGSTISTPSWSPDGRYLAYSVKVTADSWQTWWLEVATGKTGRLTSNLIFANWRPTGGASAPLYQLFLPSIVK